MKVLLRNLQTGLFYAGPDQWSPDHLGAMDFQQTEVALDRVAQAGLRNMEVIMRFDEPALEIPLTVFSGG